MKTHEVIICILTGAITPMIAVSIGGGAAMLAAMCFVLAVVCIVYMYWIDTHKKIEDIEPATWQTERLED